MVQALGHLYIGGSAYFVWADPPKGGGTARRPVAGHRRTLFALSTAKPLFWHWDNVSSPTMPVKLQGQ